MNNVCDARDSSKTRFCERGVGHDGRHWKLDLRTGYKWEWYRDHRKETA